MAETKKSLYRRLTSIFRSGVPKKRKNPVLNELPQQGSSLTDMIRRNQNFFFNNVMSSVGSVDRQARYMDFSEYAYIPEVQAALNVYSSDIFAKGDNGHALHVFSENPTILKLLTDLFYNVLNIDREGYYWAYNFCKYGDFFGIIDVHPESGVVGFYPVPVNEIEIDFGFDPNNPLATRYRWVTQNNIILQNWQMAHFKIMADNEYHPYGTSVLDSVRRYLRLLILQEDAMLIYRIVRAPERRVFYIDVGSVSQDNVDQYIEQVKASLKTSTVAEKDMGRVDLRFNPMNVLDDYFLAVRGQSQTKIDTLKGGENTAAIEDIEYVQNKIAIGTGIPKAYLNFGDELSSKASLSSIDIQFSRRINRLQELFLTELEKIALIHLVVNGVEGADLYDFQLKLTNPSVVGEQQKLELWRQRLEIMSSYRKESTLDQDTLRKEILGLSDKDIERVEQGLIKDQMRFLKLNMIQGGEGEGGSEMGGMGGGDIFGGGGGETSPLTAGRSIQGDILFENNEFSYKRMQDEDPNAFEERIFEEYHLYKNILDDCYDKIGRYELSETLWSKLSPAKQKFYMRKRNRQRRNPLPAFSNLQKMSGAGKDANYKSGNSLSNPNTDTILPPLLTDERPGSKIKESIVSIYDMVEMLSEESIFEISDELLLEIESKENNQYFQMLNNIISEISELEIQKGNVILPDYGISIDTRRYLQELKRIIVHQPRLLDNYRVELYKLLIRQNTSDGLYSYA